MANPEVTKGILGSIPSLIGLATQLGTAIPGLKKQKRIRTQQGAAGEVAGGVARAAVGASQTGFGATRGLNLRTGLRQAGQVAKESGGAIAQAAGRDERQTQILQTQRNLRLAEFGGDLADMGANIGQSVIEAKAARDAELAANAEMIAGLEEPQFDLGGGPLLDPQGADAQAQQLSQGEPQQVASPQGPLPEQGGPELRQAAASIDPLEAFYGVPSKETIYRAAPELQLQHTLENLALQEAERQGLPLARIYARIQRLQNLPAIRAAQTRLELSEEFQDF
jgi:hypothetical protein